MRPVFRLCLPPPKGGEVEYNEYMGRLSYEALDCESEKGIFVGCVAELKWIRKIKEKEERV